MEEIIIKLDNEEIIDGMSTLFKMFSDSTRIKIMESLISKSLNVAEIANLLKMSQSAISHQLAILKANRLLKSQKSGKEVYYSLADTHILSILLIGKEHVEELL